MVDDVKLELYPNQQDQYAYKLKQLSKLLVCSNLYVAVGNHDLSHLIQKHLPHAHISKYHGQLETPFGKIHYAHKYDQIKDEKGDYSLFGHDLMQKSQLITQPILLNGLDAIYVFDSNTKEIIAINYPRFTNAFRLKTSRIGF